ncbi:MAG: hypothetical protein P8X73_07395 [Ignavibacteriaceae bacterium]
MCSSNSGTSCHLLWSEGAPGGGHLEIFTCLLFGGFHDRDGIYKGMAEFYLKFKELNIPSELHIYANADHGFGIRPGDKWPVQNGRKHSLRGFMMLI